MLCKRNMRCLCLAALFNCHVSSQKVADELFPKKDGKILTSDIDYVDVWRVRIHERCFTVH